MILSSSDMSRYPIIIQPYDAGIYSPPSTEVVQHAGCPPAPCSQLAAPFNFCQSLAEIPVFSDLTPMSAYEIPQSALFADIFGSAPIAPSVFGADVAGAGPDPTAQQLPATHCMTSQANGSAFHALDALMLAPTAHTTVTPPPDVSVQASAAATESLLFGGGFSCALPLATDFLPTLIPSPAMSAGDNLNLASRTPDLHNNSAASEIFGSAPNGDTAYFSPYLSSHVWTSGVAGPRGQLDTDAGIRMLNGLSTATTSHDGRAAALCALSSFREQLQSQHQPLAFRLPTLDAAACAFVPYVSSPVCASDGQQTPSTSSKRRRLEGLAGSNASDVRTLLPEPSQLSAGYALSASSAADMHVQQYRADDLRKTTVSAGHRGMQRRKLAATALWHDNSSYGYARHSSESSDSHSSTGSPAPALSPLPRRPNNKNQPRNTNSNKQKAIFYQWLIDHIDRPFPTDKERESLCIEGMNKRDFNYWFSNTRHRNLECVPNESGHKSYQPRLGFYKNCARLGLYIPWGIPESIKRQLKHASPRTKLAPM
ncbi:hypothetical protein GGI20_005874 [Coemansia sp. BCRC 34301]|nr:hypothetical protein GGI20_005874 [Coemansia sp. BCRC 34301]